MMIALVFRKAQVEDTAKEFGRLDITFLFVKPVGKEINIENI